MKFNNAMFIIFTTIIISNCATLHTTNNNINKAEIILLGAIHDHSKSQRYSYEVLVNLINKITPDVILFEWPVDWFNENGTPKESTLKLLSRNKQSETIAAWKYCQHNNISCIPYDIRGRNDHYKKVNFFERQNKFFDFAFNLIKKRNPLAYDGLLNIYKLTNTDCGLNDPRIINSEVCDSIIMAKQSFLNKVFIDLMKTKEMKKYPDRDFLKHQWYEYEEKREQEMANNICDKSKKYIGKRILVTVGFEHRPTLKERIKACETADYKEYYNVI